jgi:hypothetical protein
MRSKSFSNLIEISLEIGYRISAIVELPRLTPSSQALPNVLGPNSWTHMAPVQDSFPQRLRITGQPFVHKFWFLLEVTEVSYQKPRFLGASYFDPKMSPHVTFFYPTEMIEPATTGLSSVTTSFLLNA